MRRPFVISVAVFFGLWLGLMLLGRSSLLKDPGSLWHVAVGQRMLESGQLVREDPFSCTRFGEPWVAHQWLAECGMAAVHRLGGLDALVLVTAVLLAVTFAGVSVRMARAGFHPLAIAVVLALALAAGSPQFHARPLVVSIALLGFSFAMLLDVDAGRRRLGTLWWLVPLMALWANLHAGVLTGIGTLGLTAGAWSLAWLLGKPSPVENVRQWLALVGLVAACCGAVLLNPYGLGLPAAWFRTLAIPLPGLIEEHAPLDLTTPVAWAVLTLGAGYLAALLAGQSPWPRATWLLPVVWLVLAILRVRNAPLFAVCAALALADVLPVGRFAPWLRRGEWLLEDEKGAELFYAKNGPGRCRVLAPFVAPFVVLIAGLSIQAAGSALPVVGRGWARLDPAVWPVELLPELDRIERDQPAGTPVFNELDFGGFLIYHTPRLRVFIDDRCALYGRELLEAYDCARRQNPAQLDRWQQQYGFRHALVKTGGPLDRYLEKSGNWSIIDRTSPAALYVHTPDAATAGR